MSIRDKLGLAPVPAEQPEQAKRQQLDLEAFPPNAEAILKMLIASRAGIDAAISLLAREGVVEEQEPPVEAPCGHRSAEAVQTMGQVSWACPECP